MHAVRLPAAAMPLLRARVEGFLRMHTVPEAAHREVELDCGNLAAFLLAALGYTRDEHPWIGRTGAVLDPPDAYPPATFHALCRALRWGDDDAPSVDAALAALVQTVPVEVVDAACGLCRPPPRVYPMDIRRGLEVFRTIDGSLLDERVFGVVAEEKWMGSAASRDAVFHAALPLVESAVAFVELDTAAARSLARALFAGPTRPESRRAYASQAEALVGLFGEGTRAFAPRGLDVDDGDNPFARGVAWTRSHAGCVSSGLTAAMVVTDGERLAIVDIVWDVSSE